VSHFLFRLGCFELLPIFPKKEFVYVSDLKVLNIHRLTNMYLAWREKLASGDKKNDKNNNNNKNDKNANKKKKNVVPTETLQKIIDLVRIPFVPHHPTQRKFVEDHLKPVQEFLSPLEFNEFVMKEVGSQ
jgi:hypothetical protein